MSDVIRLLPDSVANQIAAGEVIQRPASVLKELVENSIDAGSTVIQILIVDAGRTNIQVIDNGKGMSHTDARFCFERHATSKIQSAADLFSLTTKGFRGEALASIAAVAQVELKTRMEGEELGTWLTISGSKVENQEVLSTPVGSNFSVKNLFFNIPARRKFLKSNHTELSHILTEFERIALVHPEVSFTLHHNGQELFNLPGGNRRQRIIQLFGKKMQAQLLPVEAVTSLVHVHGFVAKPDSSRKKGAHSFFFVNNRYMRHPYFHKAVMEAYEKLIPPGEQVSYFLYLTVAPSDIDVNIHPTKTEIKFENEVPIWQIVMAAVKEALGKFECTPRIDFDTADRPEIPVYHPSVEALPVVEPRVEYDPSYNPFTQSGSYRPPSPRVNPGHWEDLYKGYAASVPSGQGGSGVLSSPDFSGSVKASSVQVPLYSGESPVEAGYQPIQLKGRYVLLSVKSGLMLIDQRRAHVRILFDLYLNQLETKQGFSQRLLFPEIIEFSPTEAAFLKEIEEDLRSIGFDLSNLGGGSFAINAAPSGVEGISPARLVGDLLHAAMEKGSAVKDQIQYELALTMARSSAIVYGQVLSPQEMTKLVGNLFSSKTPNYSPDGKTVHTIIKEEELERLFK